MKISPILNTYSGINSSAKHTSFNGLWGLTSSNNDIEPTLGINMVYETYYYHPFIDESDAEIQEVIKNNSNAYIDDRASQPKYIVKECKLCPTLPFKKINYENYRLATEGARYTTNNRKVHLSVRNKFLNNTYEKQKSAQNPIFNEKEKAKLLDLMS